MNQETDTFSVCPILSFIDSTNTCLTSQHAPALRLALGAGQGTRGISTALKNWQSTGPAEVQCLPFQPPASLLTACPTTLSVHSCCVSPIYNPTVSFIWGLSCL